MTRPPPLTPPALPPDEADLLAAEYALGVLDAAARAEAEARRAADPAFAAAVEDWAARLAPLDDTTPPAPAPDLMPRIEARLFGAPAPRARRGEWRGWLAGGLATLLAAAAAVWLTIEGPPTGPVPAPQPVARVAGASGAVFAVAWDRGSRTLTAIRTGGPAPAAGRTHQLWAIAPGRPPVSVGLLGAGGLTVAWDDPAGLLFAVSLEPEGGSPSGLPTGPVIAAGFADL